MSSLKIGIIGGASIAERYLIPAIQELPEHFRLVGLASRTSENAAYFSQKFRINTTVGYDEFLGKKNLDAVYIPLPTGLHYEWVKKSLKKGLHVLVEKSLACSYQEVDELTTLAKERGLALVENFQFRFHSQLQRINSLIKEQRIGELRCVRSAFGFPPFPDPDNIRYRKELGGGALLDAGAYTIKISRMFLDDSCKVAGASLYRDEEKGVDTWGGGFLKSGKEGLFSEIAFGFDHHYQCELSLWGSKGKLTASRIFTAPPGFEPEIVLENGKGKEVIKLESDNHFKAMLRHFFEQCIKGGTDSEHQQNLSQAHLIESFILKAAE